MYPTENDCTAWCSEIGSLMSLNAPELHASSDVREPISLHHAVLICFVLTTDQRTTLNTRHICRTTKWRWVAMEIMYPVVRSLVAYCNRRNFRAWLNLVSAELSFQLWYPGGQRFKGISFSWSRVDSSSKCFSNTEPTTIIASRDEKRCNTSVQWTRLVHSLRLGDQHWKCHGWLLFFAFCALQSDRLLQLYIHVHENSEVQNGSDIEYRKQAPQKLSLRQDPPPPWFEFLVIFDFFAPWYRRGWEASSVKIL